MFGKSNVFFIIRLHIANRNWPSYYLAFYITSTSYIIVQLFEVDDTKPLLFFYFPSQHFRKQLFKSRGQCISKKDLKSKDLQAPPLPNMLATDAMKLKAHYHACFTSKELVSSTERVVLKIKFITHTEFLGRLVANLQTFMFQGFVHKRWVMMSVVSGMLFVSTISKRAVAW